MSHHCGTACVKQHTPGYEILPVESPDSLGLRGIYWRCRKVLAALHGTLNPDAVTWPDEAPRWFRVMCRRLT